MSFAAAQLSRQAADLHARGNHGLAEVIERMAQKLNGENSSSFSITDLTPKHEEMRNSSPQHEGRKCAQVRTVADVWEPCNDPIERVIVTELRRRPGEAIDSGTLASLAQTTRRTVRAKVGHLRRDHQLPIGSSAAGDEGGFFWPRRPEDLDHTFATFGSRRAEIDAAVEGMRAGVERCFGTGEFQF